VWESVLNSMLAAFADFLAELLFEWAKGELIKAITSDTESAFSGIDWSGLGSTSGNLFAGAFWGVFAGLAIFIVSGLLEGLFGGDDTIGPLEWLKKFEAGEILFTDEQLMELKTRVAESFGSGLEEAWSNSSETMGRELEGLFETAGLEKFFIGYANDTVDTLEERFSDLDLTEAGMDLIESFLQAMESAGGLTGKFAQDLGIDEWSLNVIATLDDASFGDQLAALGLVASATGWDSEVTLDFITKFTGNEFVDLEDKLNMLGFVVSSTGWESTATITFITSLIEEGVGWADLEEALILFGADEETTRTFRLKFIQEAGEISLDWDALSNMLLGVGLDPDVLLTIQTAFQSADNRMTWEQLIDMLETMGISEEIINQLFGEINPDEILTNLADDGVGPSTALESLVDDGIGPSSRLDDIYRNGIDVDVNYSSTESFHSGGMLKKTGFFIGHEGEGVLSQRGMAALGALNSGGSLGGDGGVVVVEPNIQVSIGNKEIDDYVVKHTDATIVARNRRKVRPNRRMIMAAAA
ncbi:hypothetical protein LCGC14_1171300, partial [marine sediment metagenome]